MVRVVYYFYLFIFNKKSLLRATIVVGHRHRSTYCCRADTPTESDSTSATATTDSDGVFDFVAQSSTIVFTTPASGVTNIQHDFAYVYLLAIN
jgi:hypothetical protein